MSGRLRAQVGVQCARTRRGRLSAVAVAVAVALALPGVAAGATPDPDPTYGDGGVRLHPLGSHSFASISDMALQPDGKLVAVGTVDRLGARVTVVNDFAVARFLPTGELDTTFNAGGATPGVRTTPFHAEGSTAAAVAVGPTGEIVAVGSSGPSGSELGVIQRLLADGSVDAGFSPVESNFGQDAVRLRDVAVRSDGRIVVAGQATVGTESRHLVAQVLTSGAPDSSFGTGGSGRTVTQFGTTSSSAQALALDSGGSIVTVGAATRTDGQEAHYARFSPAGALTDEGSASFGLGASASALALHPDGQVTAAGSASAGRLESRVFLARFRQNGELSGSFGNARTPGRTTQKIGDGDTSFTGDVALLYDGGVRIVGAAENPSRLAAFVAQYTNAGQPDPDFDPANGSNHRLYAIGTGGISAFSAISLLPSGLYLAAGLADVEEKKQAVVARLGGTAQAPVGDFTFTRRGSVLFGKPIRPGERVHFDGSSSSDADGTVVSYQWDLDGDGTFETEGDSPSRVYEFAGDHEVSLRVTDSDGLRDDVTRAVSVVDNGSPSGEITAVTGGNAQYGVPYKLSGASSSDGDGSIVRYEWSFDGEPGFEVDTGSDPSVTWVPAEAAPGYTIRMRVTDDEGATADVGRTFDVKGADFELEPFFFTGNSDDGLLLKKGQTSYVGIDLQPGPGATGPYDYNAEVIGNPGFTVATGAGFGYEGSDRLVSVTAPHDADEGGTLVRLRVTAPPKQGSPVKEFLFVVNVVREFDPRIVGIEVNQGIQTEAAPCDLRATIPANFLPPDPVTLSRQQCAKNQSLKQPSKGTYKLGNRKLRYQLHSGLQLIEEKKTVVRVFANTDVGKADGYTALLHAYDSKGKELKGSPLSPETAPKQLKAGKPHVTFVQRSDAREGIAFVLPASWTRKGPVLEARLSATQNDPTATECTKADCKANDRLALIGFNTPGLYFRDTGYIRVGTARLDSSSSPSGTPGLWFELAEKWAPLADGALRYNRQKWYAILQLPSTIFEPGETVNNIRTFLDDYADDENDDNGCGGDEFCADQVVGVFGTMVANGGVSMGGIVNSVQDPVAVGWTQGHTIAHEMFHGWGETPHTFTRESCLSDPEDTDQLGEASDASGMGLLEGIGIDTEGGLGGAAPFRIVAPTSLGAPPAPAGHAKQHPVYVDVLSYCRDGDLNGADRWISVGGWKRLLELAIEIADDNDRTSTASVAQAVPREVLRVQAHLEGDGTVEIRSVKPREGRRPDPGTPGWTLRALAADGSSLAEAPATVMEAHDGADPLIVGEVAARRAVGVALVRDGAEVARRVATASAPRVTVTAPRKGQRVGSRGSLEVRWRATDADGDALVAKVDYSVDGGRDWQTLAIGPNKNRAKLPAAALAGSRKARIRVRVNDGFNQTEALSSLFRAAGTRPSVSITSPRKRASSPVGAAVYLSGTGTSDRGDALTGRRLTWYAGKRRLGVGEQLSVATLRAGRHRIRLVARDRAGRTGTARVLLRVKPSTPLFTTLAAPAKVSRRARVVRLRVASNVPATLRVAKRRYAVGPRTRRIAVRVRPGRQPLVLPLRLGGGKFTAARTVVVRRGSR